MAPVQGTGSLGAPACQRNTPLGLDSASPVWVHSTQLGILSPPAQPRGRPPSGRFQPRAPIDRAGSCARRRLASALPDLAHCLGSMVGSAPTEPCVLRPERGRSPKKQAADARTTDVCGVEEGSGLTGKW